MPTLLETLKKVSFFQGIRCPYELLVLLYHAALPYESGIIDERRHAGPNKIGDYIARMDLDEDTDSFNIDVALFDLAAMTLNDSQAALLVFELLNRLDIYLSGADGHQYREGKGTAIPSPPLDRLANPFYYRPVEVSIDGQKVSSTIVPVVEPLYTKWIEENNVLPRDEKYFGPSLATCCLNHHRLLHEGRVGNQEITFPVNGVDAQKHSSFLQSFCPTGKSLDRLIIALAPYDSGFRPDLIAYEETDRNTVTFRYLRTLKPSRLMVKRKIEEILTAARDRGVDILIFPELTVDHDAFTTISDFLAHHNTPEELKLVVAGSFHRERTDGGYVNSAPMLDWQGKVVWQHHKLQRYMMLSQQIAKCPDAKKLRKQFQASAANDIEENIRTSHPLTFVDTPIGRMATLICLDYLLENVTQAIARVGCDYLWVPLMTTSTGMFKSHAKDLYGAKHHVLSAFSASVGCCEMFGCKDSNLSFLYAPSQKFGKLDDPPGIVRDENLPLIIYRLDTML